MKNNKTTITVVGGGNSSITLISLLTRAGHKVNLLTRSPEKWSKNVSMELINPDGSLKEIVKGVLNKISSRPSEVIPDSEIIVLSLPVSKYRLVLHSIAPFFHKNRVTYLGTIYGQGGFNWMVDEIITKFELKNIIYFSSGLIPWITRLKEYGKTGMNFGSKSVNIVAVQPKGQFSELNDLILDDLCYSYFGKGKYQQAENFISLTLSVDNQIIHLSRLLGLHEVYGDFWKHQNDVPFFYRDYDDHSADLLEKLDSDYTMIRQAIEKLFPSKSFKYMLNYLDLERLSYSSASTNIKESFINSKTLNQITTPVVKIADGLWTFDKNHRFFTDDLFYGVAIAKWIAQKLYINTPTIDKIIEWAQSLINVKIMEKGILLDIDNSSNKNFQYGLPSTYGFTNIDQIID